MKVDLHSVLDQEYWNEETEKTRAELGELKGYKGAIEEAEEAMARITASNLVKMSNEIDIE